ncbi:Co2+/Mg2+ efflux protein ApaG [Chitinibacter fontanus]|uniref:Protein ApaG n=1 Tax=Chitinibacter fontanus TaxID=1737446 RepID=A0A7D5ZAR0_9NEIS|nr:Co2+/Mg2+ efflux protein ApaG [Chitinibacter fontanus]QLI80104.1 Co2+/Mg2+ efflux protein ApaG [Chitinibacter fontanus]
MEHSYQIRVTARPFYLPEQSDEAEEQYTFAYQITIENAGSITAKLIARHWIIEDAGGKTQEVRGLGVIGEHPELAPGETFEYTSGVTLATPVGTMRGTYQMIAADGTEFEAEIAQFVLSMPRTLH